MTQLSFSIHENRGVFALLLGSGLSKAADIPTGWEITVDLLRRVALAQGEELQVDYPQWYKGKTGRAPSYSDLLEELASSPDERRSILQNYIEPSDSDREQGKKVPTRAHLAIADLVRAGYIKVIITTNFDRLLENALRDRGVEPTIIASVDALSGAEPITHANCYVVKLHGDYKDARILNTDTELKAYPKKYDRLLDRIFDEYGLIVAGWSGEWDFALSNALMRAPSRRYQTYWAARGNLGAKAQTIANHRRARLVPISNADSLFVELKERLETLALSQRQNPLSIDLLVSSAKRFLSKPEFRIQLEELFSSEAERLQAQLDSFGFSFDEQWNANSIQQRVARYETATESLAKMAGILGRWGDGSEFRIILNLLNVMFAYAEKPRGGTVGWLKIHSYPVVLIYTAYCIGLTNAERWASLKEISSAEVSVTKSERIRAVEALFSWGWKGGDNEIWKNLEGMSARYTALSDHLCALFVEWQKSFTGLVPDHEALFEKFEIFQSLAHLTSTAESDLEFQLANSESKRVRMPVGRLGWHFSARNRLFSELQSSALRKTLVGSGLIESEKFVDLFQSNFEQVVTNLKWH